MEEFLEYLDSTDRSEGTIYNYEKDLKGFFCWGVDNCKNVSFVDLKKRSIMKYQNYLLNTLNLGSSRIRRVKSAMSSMSNFIVRILDEDYPNFKNIVNNIEAPVKNVVREKTVFEDEEIKAICDGFVEKKQYQKACFFAVLASSGMRKSEASRLKASWFNDDNILYDSIYKTPEQIKTKGRGKKGYSLNKYFLISLLQPYLDLWLKEREKLGVDIDDLFVLKNKDDNWRPVKVSTFNSWVRTANQFIEKEIYAHAFRHYLDTYMHKKNIPSHIIQAFFGWRSSDMVQLYCDIKEEDEFGKFFGADGVKEVQQGGLNTL